MADAGNEMTGGCLCGAVDDLEGLRLTSEIYIDRKPDGYGFAGHNDKKTKAEVEAYYAAPSEGDLK